MDYDPFINAQDYDPSAIQRTLEVTPLPPNVFRVSFFVFDAENEQKTTIHLLVQQNEKGKYFIDEILNQ